jgi:hypothetical protein
MIITEFVIYRNKPKLVKDLSPTCGYRVQVKCPECNEIRTAYYRAIMKSGNCLCHKCAIRLKLSKHMIVGEVFGNLTVIGIGEKSGTSICKCICGNTIVVENYGLRTRGTKSCGCVRSTNIAKVRVTHSGENHWNWQGGNY